MQFDQLDKLSQDYFSPTKEALYLEAVARKIQSRVIMLVWQRNWKKFLKCETIERFRKEIHENIETIFLFKSGNNQFSKKFYQTMKAIIRRINRRKSTGTHSEYTKACAEYLQSLKKLRKSKDETWFILSFLRLYGIKEADLESIIVEKIFEKQYLKR